MAELTVTVADEYFEVECSRCGDKAHNRVTALRLHPAFKKWFATDLEGPEGWYRLSSVNGGHIHLCGACMAAVRGRINAELAAKGRDPGEIQWGFTPSNDEN